MEFYGLIIRINMVNVSKKLRHPCVSNFWNLYYVWNYLLLFCPPGEPLYAENIYKATVERNVKALREILEAK